MVTGKSTQAKDGKPIVVNYRSDEDPGEALAKIAVRPAVQAAVTTQLYATQLGQLEVADLIAVLTAQTETATDGDAEPSENMLTAQAHTLDAIFNRMAQQAAQNIGHYPDTVQRYLKLALRAQSQCRSTWEAIATIKNPPVANFVGQANISNGPQQVNNGEPRTRKNENAPNELLEEKGGSEWMDRGTARPASAPDKDLEAVGSLNRAENDRGKTNELSKRL